MPTLINETNDPNINTAVGGPPVASDDIRLIRQGPVAYTEGLTDWTALALASLHHGGDCATNLGGPNNPITLDVGDLRIRGAHRWAYIAGVATKTITTAVLGGRVGTVNSIANATITNLYCVGGDNTIEGTCDVTDAEVGNCRLAMQSGGAKGTELVANSGAAVELGRDFASVVCHGGVVEATHADAAVDAVEVTGGGVFRPIKALPGALTLRDGATLDMSRIGQPLGAITVNILGAVRVINAAGLGDWRGSATIVNPADYGVQEIGGLATAGV